MARYQAKPLKPYLGIGTLLALLIFSGRTIAQTSNPYPMESWLRANLKSNVIGMSVDTRQQFAGAIHDFLGTTFQNQEKLEVKRDLVRTVERSFRDCRTAKCYDVFTHFLDISGTDPDLEIHNIVLNAMGFIASWNRIVNREDVNAAVWGPIRGTPRGKIICEKWPMDAAGAGCRSGDFCAARMAANVLAGLQACDHSPTVRDGARSKLHNLALNEKAGTNINRVFEEAVSSLGGRN